MDADGPVRQLRIDEREEGRKAFGFEQRHRRVDQVQIQMIAVLMDEIMRVRIGKRFFLIPHGASMAWLLAGMDDGKSVGVCVIASRDIGEGEVMHLLLIFYFKPSASLSGS